MHWIYVVPRAMPLSPIGKAELDLFDKVFRRIPTRRDLR